jgi:hypothetical protein
MRAGLLGAIDKERTTSQISRPVFFRNQPLEFFSEIFSSRISLIHDPLPCEWAPYFDVPLACKHAFQGAVNGFCKERGVHLIMQREETINASLMTKNQFQRKPGDYFHVVDRVFEWFIEDLPFA